jgi:hypothetical protein
VFMQRLIPLVYWDLLPKGIWDALTEINYFFRDICSNKLQTQHMERLETNITQTIWKLEMIFPPFFFDSMEHLLIHLSFEVKIKGLVQYKWMYASEMIDRKYKYNMALDTILHRWKYQWNVSINIFQGDENCSLSP